MESRFHPLVIEKLFEVIYNGMVYQANANAIMYRDWGQLDQYCKPYKNVAVSKDEDRNEYYSILPAPIMQLPENRGIRLISPMKDQKNKFLYIDNASGDIWGDADVFQVINEVTFYPENDRVYYGNFAEDYQTQGVLMKLIVPLSEFGTEDEIGIPAQRSMEIFAMITEMLSKRNPEDQVNDNVSKQV